MSPLSGQQIKKAEASLADYAQLLKAAGYELFSFDISNLLKEGQTLVVECHEYANGEQLDREIFSGGDITHRAEKINFGFRPSGNDSTKLMQLDIPGVIMKPNLTFKLRGMSVADYPERTFYYYNTRPFELALKIEENKFIPLLILGSAWYDERSRIFRFCGEKELAPDMSSKILKDLPHYYVIGITITKQN